MATVNGRLRRFNSPPPGLAESPAPAAGAPPPAGRGTPATPRWQVLTVGVLAGAIMGTAFTAVALRPHPNLVAAPPDHRARVVPEADNLPAGFVPPANASAVSDGAVPAASATSPPVELAIPVIGVDTRLEGVRLDPDGSLAAPTDFDHAGWYSDGPAPGAAGAPAVIVGHVDSTKGPAVFYRLRDLRVGDPILFRRADGTTVKLVVYKTAQFAKSAFPAPSVYAATGQPEVRLITCTGEFDKATGHYLGNFVVFAAEAPPRAT